MKRTFIILVLISMSSTPVYALNLLDRIANKEVLVKSSNQKLMVDRLTGEVRFIWQRPTPVVFYGSGGPDQGEWVKVTDEGMKKFWQDIYDKERAPKEN